MITAKYDHKYLVLNCTQRCIEREKHDKADKINTWFSKHPWLLLQSPNICRQWIETFLLDKYFTKLLYRIENHKA